MLFFGSYFSELWNPAGPLTKELITVQQTHLRGRANWIQAEDPGACFSKLSVITGPVELFCFLFQMEVSKGLQCGHSNHERYRLYFHFICTFF